MTKLLKNKQGISILLVVLILSSLMVLTVALSTIVLRVGKSTRQIGQSEVAFFAAETAIEKGLYEIEKNHSVANLNVSEMQTLSTSGGQWTRLYTLNDQLTFLCSQLGSQEGFCVDSAGVIDANNPLKVNLEPGHSFQVDMNFIGMALPNTLHLVEKNGAGRIIALSTDGQTTYTDSPVNLSDLKDKLYLLRLVNEHTKMITFTVKPANGNLTLGIILRGVGTYKEEMRIIEVERKNWQIY